MKGTKFTRISPDDFFREEELSKKRKFDLDSSEEEEYYEKIDKKRVPGEGRKKKELKARKLRLTKSHLPYYSSDQIIDLTSLDSDFTNPVSFQKIDTKIFRIFFN